MTWMTENHHQLDSEQTRVGCLFFTLQVKITADFHIDVRARCKRFSWRLGFRRFFKFKDIQSISTFIFPLGFTVG